MIRSRLASHSWGIFENKTDVDSLFDSFYDSLKEIILDTCYASRLNPGSKKTAPLNHWMTTGLLKSW